MSKSSSKPLKITALTVAEMARVLASASGRQITEDEVRSIAEGGGLIHADGTINLLEYTAFLVGELGHGSD